MLRLMQSIMNIIIGLILAIRIVSYIQVLLLFRDIIIAQNTYTWNVSMGYDKSNNMDC